MDVWINVRVGCYRHKSDQNLVPGLLALLAVILFLSAAPVFAIEQAALSVEYEPVLEGVQDNELEALLKAASDSFSMKETPPASFSLLRARVENDLTDMAKVLRSRGFFTAKLKVEIDKKAGPVRVVFNVEPGEPFVLSEVTFTPVSPPAEYKLPSPEDLGLIGGQPYRAAGIVQAQEQLLEALKRNGFPFPAVTDRKIVADHATRQVSVNFLVDTGPEAAFGPTTFTGLVAVDEKYVAKQIPWREGDRFDIKILQNTKADLLGLGLFSVVDITLGRVDSEGRLPVGVAVIERSFKTVRLGLGYQSDTGKEFKFGWEHRNLLGGGEKLFLSLRLNEVKQTFEAEFRKPRFFSEKQTLIFKSSLLSEETDAFDTKSFENSVYLERSFKPSLLAGFGLLAIYGHFEETDRQYGHYALPVYLRWDTSNDLLDPSRGGRLNVVAAPYFGFLDNSVAFQKYHANYRHYFDLVGSKRLIFAFKGGLGVIDADNREEVPPSELFYAGGGGSVRGYPYQFAGDVEDDEPLGGLSLLELSGELRIKMTKTLGLVTFLDAGRAYESKTPEWGEDLFWGAGLGFRYYTSIGPVRLDLGFPLDKREGVDDDYQIYVSIGQAF